MKMVLERHNTRMHRNNFAGEEPARSFLFIYSIPLGINIMWEIAGLLATHVAISLIGYFQGTKGKPLL